MNSLYYYTFYVFAKLARKINRKDKSPDFTAVLWISIPMFLNILSVIIYFGGVSYHESRNKVWLLAIFVALPIILVNYFLLNKNNKSQMILSYYDNKYASKKQNLWIVTLIIFYIVVTFGVCFFLAYQNRKHLGI